MITSKVYSTVLRDGEDLTKINSWLANFRAEELILFKATRVTKDSIRILLEVQDQYRLRIFASNPPHQSYLATTKTVPLIQVVFTEPIDEDSLTGNVSINGSVVDVADMSLSADCYRLSIDTSNYGDLTVAGMHEVIFADILHKNKIWKLCGERKILWSTSEHGGSRGGEDIWDQEKSGLVMGKISVESIHSDKQIFEQFLSINNIDPADVVDTQLLSAYPEFDRTTLLIIYRQGVKIPYVKCVNPEYKACFFQDGSPDPVEIHIGFTEAIDEDALDGNVYFDNSAVSSGNMTLSQGNKLLKISVTPAEYKHHSVRIDSLTSGSYTRSWPYFFSFVIHKFVDGGGGGGGPSDQDIDDLYGIIGGIYGELASIVADVAKNTTDITQNTTDILNNTNNIINLDTLANNNRSLIEQNIVDIQQNTISIVNNTADIAQNVIDIAQNAADIAQNTSDIAQNASDILQNASDIAQNAADILVNAGNIATNTASIVDIYNQLDTKSDIGHNHDGDYANLTHYHDASHTVSGTFAVARLPVLVGDSGSGGTAGIVPAPASGDAAAGKFLKADGTWTAPTITGTWVSTGGAFKPNTTYIAAGDYIQYISRVADGATAIAHRFNTENALTTNGSTIARFSEAGSTTGDMYITRRKNVAWLEASGSALTNYIGIATSLTNADLGSGTEIYVSAVRFVKGTSTATTYTELGSLLNATGDNRIRVSSDTKVYGSLTNQLTHFYAGTSTRGVTLSLGFGSTIVFDSSRGTPATIGDTYIQKDTQTGGSWKFVYDGVTVLEFTSSTVQEQATIKTLLPYGTSTGQTGTLRLRELAAGGSNYVGFKAPDAITTNVEYVIPEDGTKGKLLQTDGAGTLSWGGLHHGGMSVEGNTTPQVITTGGTLEKLTAWNAHQPSNATTPDATTNNHITVEKGGNWNIKLSGNLSGTASTVIELAIYKNGTTALAKTHIVMDGSGTRQPVSLDFIATLADSDAISLYGTTTNDSESIVLRDMFLTLMRAS